MPPLHWSKIPQKNFTPSLYPSSKNTDSDGRGYNRTPVKNEEKHNKFFNDFCEDDICFKKQTIKFISIGNSLLPFLKMIFIVLIVKWLLKPSFPRTIMTIKSQI